MRMPTYIVINNTMNHNLYVIINYNTCFAIVTATNDKFDCDLLDIRSIQN